MGLGLGKQLQVVKILWVTAANFFLLSSAREDFLKTFLNEN